MAIDDFIKDPTKLVKASAASASLRAAHVWLTYPGRAMLSCSATIQPARGAPSGGTFLLSQHEHECTSASAGLVATTVSTFGRSSSIVGILKTMLDDFNVRPAAFGMQPSMQPSMQHTSQLAGRLAEGSH